MCKKSKNSKKKQQTPDTLKTHFESIPKIIIEEFVTTFKVNLKHF